MKACLRETWSHLLCPVQHEPGAGIDWSFAKLNVGNDIMGAIARKLEHDNRLLTRIGARNLYIQLASIWGEKPHLNLRELWLHLNSFVYLPRLKDRNVLIEAV